jgi:hypothetical protein
MKRKAAAVHISHPNITDYLGTSAPLRLAHHLLIARGDSPHWRNIEKGQLSELHNLNRLLTRIQGMKEKYMGLMR